MDSLRIKNYLLVFVLLLSFREFSSAQNKSTGINTSSPSQNAALHISPSGKQGIILPRLVAKDTGVINVTAKDLGLTFYDSVGTKFWYWKGKNWGSYPNSIPSIGTGTVNQVAYWETANTLASSPIYLNNTNVGINVNPTNYTFQVRGASGTDASIQLTANNTVGNGIVLQINPTSANFINYSATPINFGTDGVNRFAISATGILQANSLIGPGIVVSDAAGNLALNKAPLLSGTGVLNKVAKWSGVSTLTTGLITDDGSNVYIGTVGAAPTADLYITQANPVGIKLNNTSATTAVALRTGYTGKLSHLMEFSDDLVFSGVSYANVGYGSGPTNYVRITNAGDVGLGVNPAARFHCNSASNLNALFESASTIGTWVDFHNSSLGGQYFSLICTGVGNSEGAGRLLLNKNSGLANNAGTFMAFDYATGYITMGTTALPTQVLHVVGNAYKTTGGTAWLTVSDVRVKENIHPFKDGLSTVMQIHPISFQYNGKAGTQKGNTEYGVIAQEIQKVAPYTIAKGPKTKLEPEDREETELLGYNSGPLLYVLINSIKELNHKVDSLHSELNKVRLEKDPLRDTKKTASISK